MITRIITAAFHCPHFILMICGGVAVFALTFALISQYGFGLYPCELCIYQRIPYAVIIFMAGLGWAATKSMGPKYGILNTVLCGLAFLINSGIAFYHVGVEQSWWASGCSLPDFSGLSPEEIGVAIRNAPVVKCDDIPFQLFGISMAGYNVILCLGMGVYALIAARLAGKPRTSE